MNTSSRVRKYATVFSILSLAIQLPIKWSSLSLSLYSLLSDHSLWRLLHTYAHLLTRLFVLNENKIKTIRGIDTVSRVEKLPAEHGVSCWKITKWIRLIFSVLILLATYTAHFVYKNHPLKRPAIYTSHLHQPLFPR